jgi:O-antigen ligase
VCSAALGFGAVAFVGFRDGGYFANTWLWLVLAFGAVVGIALIVHSRPAISRLGWLSLSGLTAFALWMLGSTLWGIPGTEAVREAGRACVYVAALGAFLVVVDRTSSKAFLGGLLGGILALESYALGQRLIAPPAPDSFEGTLLAGPLGYANALGILSAIGVLLALGFVWSSEHPLAKALFAAAAVLSSLALALTSSRGAWLALSVGLVVLVVLRLRNRGHLDARWLQAVVLAAVLAGGALLATKSPHFGDRPSYWRVAIEDAGRHPALGSGAGSFDDFWRDHRPIPASVRDAHSLYLEVVGELGAIGLALLIVALLPPLVVITRSRSDVVPFAAAGYSAFLVHAGLDWDWEIPATTLAGLACGAALLACARPHVATTA